MGNREPYDEKAVVKICNEHERDPERLDEIVRDVRSKLGSKVGKGNTAWGKIIELTGAEGANILKVVEKVDAELVREACRRHGDDPDRLFEIVAETHKLLGPLETAGVGAITEATGASNVHVEEIVAYQQKVASAKSYRKYGLTLTILGLVVMAMFPIWIVKTLMLWSAFQGNEAWPTVEGDVEYSELYSQDEGSYGRNTKYIVQVNYWYEVDGIGYRRATVHLRPPRGSSLWLSPEDNLLPKFSASGYDQAQAMVDEFPAGKKVTVHHHPEKHEIACLEPGDPPIVTFLEAGPLPMLICGGVPVLIGVILLLMGRKPKRHVLS